MRSLRENFVKKQYTVEEISLSLHRNIIIAMEKNFFLNLSSMIVECEKASNEDRKSSFDFPSAFERSENYSTYSCSSFKNK